MSARTKDRETYRGYDIIKSFSINTWYISKGGFHIQSAPSLDAAKRIVDAILGD